jgi:outer membrane lipoprotein
MKTFPKMGIFLLGILLALAMVGCSLPISGDLRREANRNLNFTQVADDPAAYVGNTVIWGGIIQKVRSTSDGTEIQIVQSPLKLDESPDLEATGGEFIAISGEVLDLNILKRGEKITVGGDIVGERIEDTKAVKFRYPVLLIKEFYLWGRGKKWWEPRPSSG